MAKADWASNFKTDINLFQSQIDPKKAVIPASLPGAAPPGVDATAAYILNFGKQTPEELEQQEENRFQRSLRLIKEQDILARSQADYRQKLGDESTQKALFYSTLAKLPDKLANAFNPYGSKEGALAYAAHLNNLPNVVNDTMRSIPMMNVQGVAYNAPQRQYFT